MSLSRRRFVKQLAALAVGAAASGARSQARAAGARVVVVGAGFGGATVAKYIRMWAPDVEVTLVERDREFISCPVSNRVLAGQVELVDLTRGYGALSSKYGIHTVYDEVVGINPDKQELTLASGDVLAYDRVIVSPGVDLLFDEIPGLGDPAARERVLHPWKAGPQTELEGAYAESWGKNIWADMMA